MFIYTHTYTYIPPTVSGTKGFWGAAAAARDSYVQRHLPRSARTGLRMGSPCNLCAWRAHGRRRGAAFPLPYACRAHWRAKTGLGMGPCLRDKVAGLLPMAVLSGARSSPPPPRDVSGLLWALTHKGEYVACMWPTCVYMYTHVYTCMPIHTIHAHMD